MATINSEVDDAAIECGLGLRTSSWLGETSDTAREFVRFIPAIARDLLDRHDWSGASTEAMVGGPSAVTVWPRPANFNRLQRGDNAVYEISPNRRPVLPIAIDGAWREMTTWGLAGAQRFYRRTAAGFEFYQPLPANGSIAIQYVTNNWIEGGKSAWDNLADVPVFPSQLIRFGLIYRWRRQKGMRYADEMAEYEAILARAIAEDRPRRTISIGNDVTPRHPMRVPVPDFIGPG